MPRSNHSSNTLSVPPAALHFRMPAEWSPHAATWLAWPHYHGDWPGKFEPIPWVYTEIIRNLARHEHVELIVDNAALERQARKLLDRAAAPLANVRFHRQPTNRSWLRDSGCIFVNSVAKRRHSLAPHVTAGIPHAKWNRVPSGTTPTRADPALPALNFRFTPCTKYSNHPPHQTTEPLISPL